MMELINKTIFILGATKFDGEIESTSFTTAKFFAKRNNVYYIDFPFTYKDFYNKSLKEPISKRKAFFKRKSNGLLHIPNSSLNVIILPLLLSINFLSEGNFYRLLLSWNERIIVKRIKKVIEEMKLEEYIFINSFNFHYPNIGSLIKPKLKAYHCVDPIITGYDMKHGFISEDIVVKNSDIVICTSKQLYREKEKVNPNTFFIPNAADLSLSAQALDVNLPIHHFLAQIPKPIIGYFGNIERRMDFKLLHKVAENNEDKSFVFVGPVDEGFIPRDFKKLKNVYFTGGVAYAEMPSILKGFDIAIIPFKKDDVSNTIFPLKLFEYLGAGKPVIASDFNLDLKEFTNDTVSYCSNAQEFTVAINQLLKQKGSLAMALRLSVAKENTWEIRLTQLSELLGSFYLIKPLSS